MYSYIWGHFDSNYHSYTPPSTNNNITCPPPIPHCSPAKLQPFTDLPASAPACAYQPPAALFSPHSRRGSPGEGTDTACVSCDLCDLCVDSLSSYAAPPLPAKRVAINRSHNRYYSFLLYDRGAVLTSKKSFLNRSTSNCDRVEATEEPPETSPDSSTDTLPPSPPPPLVAVDSTPSSRPRI